MLERWQIGMRLEGGRWKELSRDTYWSSSQSVGGLDVVDVDPLHADLNQKLDVVFVDKHCKREELVPREGGIHVGFLRSCTTEPIFEWSNYMPGPEASDLSARQGIVVNELQEEWEDGKGLLSFKFEGCCFIW